MYADVLIIAVVLLLGIIAFVFGVLHTIWRAICFVVGFVVGRPDAANDNGESTRMVCPRDACRKVEYRNATYCSQCGARLIKRHTLIAEATGFRKIDRRCRLWP